VYGAVLIFLFTEILSPWPRTTEHRTYSFHNFNYIW